MALAQDPYTGVRRAAIIALLSLGVKKSVEIIIDQLSVPDPEMKSWALDVLKQISGQDLGLDRDKWAQWWRENRNDVDLSELFPRPKPVRKKLSFKEREISRKIWARHERSVRRG
jgi:HEAT repeat protein